VPLGNVRPNALSSALPCRRLARRNIDRAKAERLVAALPRHDASKIARVIAGEVVRSRRVGMSTE